MKLKKGLFVLVFITSQIFAEQTIEIQLIQGKKNVPVLVDGKTYYEILGISLTAKSKEIAAALNKSKSKYKFDAFDVLANSDNRKKYDQILKKSYPDIYKDLELIAQFEFSSEEQL